MPQKDEPALKPHKELHTTNLILLKLEGWLYGNEHVIENIIPF
jgi:hypothetical protein